MKIYYVYGNFIKLNKVFADMKFKDALRHAKLILQNCIDWHEMKWKEVPCDLEQGIIKRWNGITKSGKVVEVYIQRCEL